jgi:hypothetical protein
MDQVWARNHVLTTLKRRHLAGEPPVGVQELQALAGMGPGDLNVTLGVLVEEHKVVRLGSDQQPTFALMPEDMAVAPAEDAAPEELPSPWAGEAAAVEQPAPAPVMTPALAAVLAANAPATPGEPQEMRLNHTMVQAIHPDVLGAMIFAGCASAAEAQAEFRLVVVP